ncbi:DNA polymerase epsilon catalytic subunit [Striga asiatica]|uniref:DNA polymerase epsilon catalytic subunit n=1 Tax=Striga asiatica TaxID=4170 RepID=A0A5A7Q0E6_STRAF|nr:DNA polymerase epsilon catalytic subunit [Striga asiatica]
MTDGQSGDLGMADGRSNDLGTTDGWRRFGDGDNLGTRARVETRGYKRRADLGTAIWLPLVDRTRFSPLSGGYPAFVYTDYGPADWMRPAMNSALIQCPQSTGKLLHHTTSIFHHKNRQKKWTTIIDLFTEVPLRPSRLVSAFPAAAKYLDLTISRRIRGLKNMGTSISRRLSKIKFVL